jgi:hypothetical protein
MKTKRPSAAGKTVRNARPPVAKPSRTGLPKTDPPRPAPIDGADRAGSAMVPIDGGYGW